MKDLPEILAELLQAQDTVREAAGGAKSEPLQKDLENIGARLGQIAADLERYIHAETTHRADLESAREFRG